MKQKIKNNIWWVGKTDWELRKFHGNELSTERGTTYNSYLVKEEKTILIDTVWKPFSKEFIKNLASETEIEKIDYLIVNHAEPDHSGALSDILDLIPGTPVYCTENGIKSLKGHYHKEWNFKPVKTGDKLNLGTKDLIFVQAPMLHWPDTMFCYLTCDNVLFSNDAFGQHYCTEYLFNDLVNQEELFQEAIKYYANILTPYSSLVVKKIQEFLALQLPLDIICPSHGVIWRNNPMQIVNKYTQWAKDFQENQITILYDTMWNSTRILAENIAKGIKQANNTINIKLFNSSNSDKNDLITEVFRSKAVIIGSPTINHGITYTIAGILEMLKGMGIKNKKAAAFGSYGWAGEGIKVIEESLKTSGFDIVQNGLKINWKPDDAGIESALLFGREFAEKLQ